MRKLWATSLILIAVMMVSGCGQTTSKQTSNQQGLPAVGDNYVVDGVNNKVVGVGGKTFEYTATGESLILVSLANKDYKAVIVPDEGEKVVVDPSKPSCTVSGVEKIDKNWPTGNYLLVEYVGM